MRKTGNHPQFHWVVDICHDDGDRSGSTLRSLSRWTATDNDDVYLELHRFSHTRSVFNSDGLALDIAEVTQPLSKCLDIQRRARTAQITDSWNFLRLLRFGGAVERECAHNYSGDK